MKLETYTIVFSIPDNTPDNESERLYFHLLSLTLADDVRMSIQQALEFHDLNDISVELTEGSDLET
jgi:hypothetical protein